MRAAARRSPPLDRRVRTTASSDNGDAGTATPSAQGGSDDSDVEERSGMKRLAEQRVRAHTGRGEHASAASA